MTVLEGGYGLLIDLATVEKRIGRLRRMLRNVNSVTPSQSLASVKTLSTTILTDLTNLNTTLQAAASIAALSDTPTLQLRDDPYQTADTHS